MKKLALFTLILFTLASVAQVPQAALKSVSPDRIKEHVKFLSSDLLEGRGTGQRGGDLAAEYIATQFALEGLQPAGDDGGFLQQVAMVGLKTAPDTKVSWDANGQSHALKLGTDIVAMDETTKRQSEFDADVVFVGYGIEAPEYNWNDYAGVDVKGKILLMLVNEPPSSDEKFFKGKALTYYGRWTYKYEQAARKGAIGAVLVHNTDMASYGWNVVQSSWGGERSYLKEDGKPKLTLASWIQQSVAQQIAQASGQDLVKLMEAAKNRGFKPVPLNVRIKGTIKTEVRPFDSANVVAKLPGSDPSLKNEAIVYTAHYDHLGIHAGQEGDNIYNGAIDNASGCGLLLEMAHVYATAAEKPKRTIVFAAVTGEEQGLLGSQYLGLHPPTQAQAISLNLNFDGVAPTGIPEEIEVSGADRTTFYPTLERTAKQFGLAIGEDSNPGAGYYYRSDHFSMARVGVPAFSVNMGSKFKGHPREWGLEQEKLYTEKNYHQPSDQFDPNWDFSGPALITKFGFALGWEAANQQQLVQWKPGDEFEAARKNGSAAASK
jgi:Zn-dependent M28 family amino/carboxypeptidase